MMNKRAEKTTYPETPDWPETLMIEPTNVCNLRCPLCWVGSGRMKRTPAFIDVKLYEHLVLAVRGNISQFSLYGQGEPFLHPNFLDMIHLATRNGIRTHVATNGHYFQSNDLCRRLIEVGLRSLSVSVDGASSKTYNMYRVGGDFNQVIDGLERLMSIRDELRSPTPRVQIQFLVFKHNEHEINDIRNLAAQLRVDALRLKTAQVLTAEQAKQYMPTNPHYRRYDHSGALRRHAMDGLNCWYVNHQPTITATGEVVPCCFDKDAKFVMGRLQQQSFYQIWHSPRYYSFRTLMGHDSDMPDICQSCTQGLKIPVYDIEIFTKA